MSIYNEYDVKSKAMTRFLEIVTTNNKSLGDRLTKRREAIYEKSIRNIQQIGVTEYARQILARNSQQRKVLEEDPRKAQV